MGARPRRARRFCRRRRHPWRRLSSSRRPSPPPGLRSAPSATGSATAPAPSRPSRTPATADPNDYHGARLQLARLGAGEATPAMSETYVRRLFDQYAARYDAALTERLAYRGPAMLRDAVERRCARYGRPLRFASMLDLGCGTGLGGRRVSRRRRPARRRRSFARHDRAGEGKGLYDRLARGRPRRFPRSPRPAAARTMISSLPPMSSSM